MKTERIGARKHPYFLSPDPDKDLSAYVADYLKEFGKASIPGRADVAQILDEEEDGEDLADPSSEVGAPVDVLLDSGALAAAARGQELIGQDLDLITITCSQG